MFTESFLAGLVLLSLAWTALGAVLLLVLLVVDWLRGDLW